PRSGYCHYGIESKNKRGRPTLSTRAGYQRNERLVATFKQRAVPCPIRFRIKSPFKLSGRRNDGGGNTPAFGHATGFELIILVPNPGKTSEIIINAFKMSVFTLSS